jgi:hypothetical protein
MTSKIALLAAAGALVVAWAGGRVAHAAGIQGVGTVGTCTLTGKAGIKPGLVFGGAVTPVTTKFSGKLTACSGGSGDGANVVGGKLKAVINSTGVNDCLALATVGLAAFSTNVKWKVAPGTPKLLPTTTNIAATPPGNIIVGPVAIAIHLAGTNDPLGSFGGNATTAVAVTDQTVADFTAACGGKGVKKFTFTGLNGASSITE